ncbi:hypothetical protein Rctr85_092 [Virus Rctr85]|nr:hypothetical protein Rctr85_092 [Virus Rctr85]
MKFRRKFVIREDVFCWRPHVVWRRGLPPGFSWFGVEFGWYWERVM